MFIFIFISISILIFVCVVIYINTNVFFVFLVFISTFIFGFIFSITVSNLFAYGYLSKFSPGAPALAPGGGRTVRGVGACAGSCTITMRGENVHLRDKVAMVNVPTRRAREGFASQHAVHDASDSSTKGVGALVVPHANAPSAYLRTAIRRCVVEAIVAEAFVMFAGSIAQHTFVITASHSTRR